MKKRSKLKLFLFLILFIELFSLISAADVAYIYKKSYNIDQNFIDAFNEMGLSVDTISETNLPSNFSSYKIIFVGDERFSYPLNLPVNEMPSIISNYYFGEEWGLTDYDGISQLASNFPLSVKIDDEIIQVYNQAVYFLGGSSIPYYFLDDNNKAPGMITAARTYTGNKTVGDFGDVISYAPAGTHLINGKTSKRTCFFGIIESEYWTPEVEQMLKDCIGFVASTCLSDSECPSGESEKYCSGKDVYKDIYEGVCLNPGTQNSECSQETTSVLVEECSDLCLDGNCVEVDCFNDADCGTDGFTGNPFCQGNDVFKNYREYNCLNPGTPSSYCVTNLTNLLFEECSEVCVNGTCLEIECYTNSDCDDSNVRTVDYCRNPGTINSYCENKEIECFNDNECGTDGFIGGEFCSGNNVARDYKDYTCLNPGTEISNCINNISSRIIEECQACENGDCITFTCSQDSDCNDFNNETSDRCVNPATNNSYCTNEPIVCFSNADCGINGYSGGFYCKNNNVFRDFNSYICMNAGTSNSYCSAYSSQVMNEDCQEICYEGSCADITCFSNADCDDSNDYTTDICQNPGTINSTCTHGGITCIFDTDCGVDMFTGDNYCSGLNVFRDFMNHTCNNPGTISSFCSNSINNVFLDNCEYDCANGICVRCNDNEDCNDEDSTTQDTCWFSGTAEAYCTQDHIECSTDEECGIDGFIDLPFCSGDNLYQNYRTFSCMNKGTPGSYCNADNDAMLVEDCAFECENSQCTSGNHDVALVNFTDAVNNIFLEYANGTEISGDLNCGDVIKAKVKVENIGNFIENVTMAGNVAGNLFLLNNIDNLIQGDSSYRSSLSPYITLAEAGIYNITITASIFGDITPENNIATRLFNVNCGLCSSDSECLEDIYGDNYCSGNNVVQDITDYLCSEPGTAYSQCIFENRTIIVEQCEACYEGSCIEFNCSNDTDCDDFDNWTIDTCNYPGTISSFCSHEEIECFEDCDCGIDGYIGEDYCSQDDLFRDYNEYTCHNKGTANSYCTNHTEPRLIEECDDLCVDGECVPVECYDDNDCGIDGFIGDGFCVGDDIFKNYRNYTCVNPGTQQSNCELNLTNLLLEECAYICVDGECEEYNNITIYTTKIVCDNEADLPNWHNYGLTINSTTATAFLLTHPTCHLQSGWRFQLAEHNTPNPGDESGIAGNWTTFGPTNLNGTASISIDLTKIKNETIRIREVFQEGYLGFSYDSSNESNIDHYTAEMWCDSDLYWYDNFDFVYNPIAGKTYYCIAFNTPLKQCYEDSDCTGESYSENYCYNGDVYRNHTIPRCECGDCGFEVITENIENCSFSCSDGRCMDQCSQNSDCGESSYKIVCENSKVYKDTTIPECLQGTCSNRTERQVLAESISKEFTCGSGLACANDPLFGNSGLEMSDQTYQFSFNINQNYDYQCRFNIRAGNYGYYDPAPYHNPLQTNENLDLYLNNVLVGTTPDPYCNTETPQHPSSTCVYKYYDTGTWRPKDWVLHAAFDANFNLYKNATLSTGTQTIKLVGHQSHKINYLYVECNPICSQ